MFVLNSHRASYLEGEGHVVRIHSNPESSTVRCQRVDVSGDDVAFCRQQLRLAEKQVVDLAEKVKHQQLESREALLRHQARDLSAEVDKDSANGQDGESCQRRLVYTVRVQGVLSPSMPTMLTPERVMCCKLIHLFVEHLEW